MPLGIGEYPPEFNPRIHGPYNPSRFYGKPDTKFGDVKLGEMGSWLARRNYSPLAMSRSVGRVYWSWAQRWLLPVKASAVPIVQYTLALTVLSYALMYPFLRYHRVVKYHW